jgi:hypothetical protein
MRRVWPVILTFCVLGAGLLLFRSRPPVPTPVTAVPVPAAVKPTAVQHRKKAPPPVVARADPPAVARLAAMQAKAIAGINSDTSLSPAQRMCKLADVDEDFKTERAALAKKAAAKR